MNEEKVKQKYDEAISYTNGDIRFRNYPKAFHIYEELADEGFALAGFYCGFMLCMGLGTEKNIERGKELLRLHENSFGYSTEAIMEQFGLFKDLNLEEKLNCIKYWMNNHQVAHALFLKTQIDDKGE